MLTIQFISLFRNNESDCGCVKHVHYIFNKNSKQSTYAVIYFMTVAGALHAISCLILTITLIDRKQRFGESKLLNIILPNKMQS